MFTEQVFQVSESVVVRTEDLFSYRAKSDRVHTSLRGRLVNYSGCVFTLKEKKIISKIKMGKREKGTYKGKYKGIRTIELE